MSEQERKASNLIADGHLEPLSDFTHNGQVVPASRLGYRITRKFVHRYFGRIFMDPDVVFTEPMLKPELQDIEEFVESVKTIIATHERVARAYLDDETIKYACPPMAALLQIMAEGQSEQGWTLDTAEFRALFAAEAVLGSPWYAARLDAKQNLDVRRASNALAALDHFISQPNNAEVVARLNLEQRRTDVEGWRDRWSSRTYRAYLEGTLGVQPL
jgi:hypothetical protein